MHFLKLFSFLSLLSRGQLALTSLFELLSPVFRTAVYLYACGCAFQGCWRQRKTSPKPSKQYNGMKLVIKCKNKAAWHFPLFQKRFLNYQVHHLVFLYLSLSLSEPIQFVFHGEWIALQCRHAAALTDSPWPFKITQNYLFHNLSKFYRHPFYFLIGHIYANKIKWRIGIIRIVHPRKILDLKYLDSCFDSPFHFVKVDMALESQS